MANVDRIPNECLKQSPVTICFGYESIDFNDKVHDAGVIKYKVHWAPTKFTSRQLTYFRKEIRCLLQWYENDIFHKCYNAHGLIVHWNSTYEPASQFVDS